MHRAVGSLARLLRVKKAGSSAGSPSRLDAPPPAPREGKRRASLAGMIRGLARIGLLPDSLRSVICQKKPIALSASIRRSAPVLLFFFMTNPPGSTRRALLLGFITRDGSAAELRSGSVSWGPAPAPAACAGADSDSDSDLGSDSDDDSNTDRSSPSCLPPPPGAAESHRAPWGGPATSARRGLGRDQSRTGGHTGGAAEGAGPDASAWAEAAAERARRGAAREEGAQRGRSTTAADAVMAMTYLDREVL